MDLQNIPSSMPEEVKKMIAQAFIEKAMNGGNNQQQFIDVAKHTEKLKTLKSRLESISELQEGDIVKWKKDLKNKKRPSYDQPVIVIKVLEEAIFDSDQNNAGSPYFKEPLDIQLGFIDEDNDFMLFYYDKRRFELFNTEQA